jgi:iron complex outermembrane receptor protein
LYTYYLAEFTGYDANGISQYKGGVPTAEMLDKQPLPKMTAGFSTSSLQEFLTFLIYGAFGHYLFNNTNIALFFKKSIGR